MSKVILTHATRRDIGDDRLPVSLLLNRTGHVVSVYCDEASAAARAKRYNDNPWLVAPSETYRGEPDPDAPYTVETWAVKS